MTTSQEVIVLSTPTSEFIYPVEVVRQMQAGLDKDAPQWIGKAAKPKRTKKRRRQS